MGQSEFDPGVKGRRPWNAGRVDLRQYALLPKRYATFEALAIGPGPDDCALGLRGLPTLELRLREAERQGLAMAQWFAERPEVLKVLPRGCPTTLVMRSGGGISSGRRAYSPSS